MTKIKKPKQNEWGCFIINSSCNDMDKHKYIYIYI